MTTLLLSPRYTPDSIALWHAAVAEGWDPKRLQRWRVVEPIRDAVMVYGEHLFAQAIAEQLSLALLRPPFDWLTRLPADYLKRKVWFAQLAAMRDYALPAFIKPADDKCFTAQVYEDASALPDVSFLPPEVPILIAEPVVWTIEFRCFILERKIVTLSVYARQGELARAEDNTWPATEAEVHEALAFTERVLGDSSVLLPPGVVLDVGCIEGRGWAVVEANPAWGSGIYGCDPKQVLYTVACSCRPMAELTEAEKLWVVSTE